MRPLAPLRPTRRFGLLATAAIAALIASGSGTVLPASARPAPTDSAPTVMYIDCSRAADGVGTQASPSNTVAAANAHAAFQPGDAILLKRGTHCPGRLHPRGNGTAAAPIVVGAYGKGARPIIDGNGTHDQTGTVELINQQYWTVQDLQLTNRSPATETRSVRSAVLIRNRAGGRIAGITIQRLAISQVVSNLWPGSASAEARDYGGISVITDAGARADSGFDGLRILNNTVVGVGRTGIMTANHSYPKWADHNIRVSGNRVTRARGDSIVTFGAAGARVDHNVSANGAAFWPCKQCGPINPWTANAGIWTTRSRNVLIDHNEAYGEHALGGDGEGFDIDLSTENVTMEYNYSHDNAGGGVLLCGSNKAIVRFNIFQNNALGQITFINSIPATNSSIYNNTIYSRVGTQARTVRMFGDFPSKTNRVRGISFFNNLIYSLDDSGYYLWPTKPKARTNTYVGVHGIGEPVDLQKGYVSPGVRAPGTGRTGLGSLNGYKVTPNQYFMTGSPIPKSVTKDFFGKTINPLKPPRGATG